MSALSSFQSLVIRGMEGGRDGEKEGQERGPSVRGGVRGFTPELFALLFKPSFLNGAGPCGGQQTAKTTSAFI